jgi:hypothetical protein
MALVKDGNFRALYKTTTTPASAPAVITTGSFGFSGDCG